MPVTYLSVLTLFIYIQSVLGNIHNIYKDFKLKHIALESLIFRTLEAKSPEGYGIEKHLSFLLVSSMKDVCLSFVGTGII